eukprot:COSAG06_NODE_9543_length_1874_cov_4.378028_2_plen_109_part_00
MILFFERIGPLVIALRPDNVPVGHQWPPTPTSIELIAASYVPTPAGSSGVRLFNLSPVRQIVIASSGLLADSLSLCLSVSLSLSLCEECEDEAGESSAGSTTARGGAA